MKKKQKRILMAVLGVAAVGLCAIQLGPILMGAPLVEQPKKSNGDGKAGQAKGQNKSGGKKKGGAPARGPKRKGPAARPAPVARNRPQPVADADPLGSLESIRVDLTATARRSVPYDAAKIHNPFGTARFERVRASSVLTADNFTLQGIVRTGGTGPNGPPKRLAIIDNRVYAVGQEVVKGVRVAAVDATSVVLAEGKARLRLHLNGNGNGLNGSRR